MHTIMVLLVGFVLLALCLLVSRWRGGADPASLVDGARIFLPLWLLASAMNMWVGVTRAGYSVAEEFPIFLLIFAIPAAVAGLVWWKHS